MAKKKKWTSNDLRDLLNTKYSDSQRYVVVYEVASGTGARAISWVDAAVFRLWPSDGCIRSAFEIKVSRKDFLNELENPKKNQWARDSFHEFWYVAPSDVIKEEELPEGCGWMKPHGNSLSIVRHASRKDKPKLTDILLCSFIRSAAKVQRCQSAALRKKVLEESSEYKEAKMWGDAAQAFIDARTKYGRAFTSDTSEALKKLEDASLDSVAKNERDQIFDILENFQTKLLGMLELFELLAHYGIAVKNEAGEYIAGTYHTLDKGSIEELQQRLKRKQCYSKDTIKKTIGWLQALMDEKKE